MQTSEISPLARAKLQGGISIYYLVLCIESWMSEIVYKDNGIVKLAMF